MVMKTGSSDTCPRGHGRARRPTYAKARMPPHESLKAQVGETPILRDYGDSPRAESKKISRSR